MAWKSEIEEDEIHKNTNITVPLKDCRHTFLLHVCLGNLLHVNKASLLHQILNQTKHSNNQSSDGSETKASDNKTT